MTIRLSEEIFKNLFPLNKLKVINGDAVLSQLARIATENGTVPGDSLTINMAILSGKTEEIKVEFSEDNILYEFNSTKITFSKPPEERVIFDGPATIVVSPTGEKTVVKCSEGDTFDPKYGYLLCKFMESSGMTRTQVSKHLKKISEKVT